MAKDYVKIDNSLNKIREARFKERDLGSVEHGAYTAIGILADAYRNNTGIVAGKALSVREKFRAMTRELGDYLDRNREMFDWSESEVASIRNSALSAVREAFLESRERGSLRSYFASERKGASEVIRLVERYNGFTNRTEEKTRVAENASRRKIGLSDSGRIAASLGIAALAGLGITQEAPAPTIPALTGADIAWQIKEEAGINNGTYQAISGPERDLLLDDYSLGSRTRTDLALEVSERPLIGDFDPVNAEWNQTSSLADDFTHADYQPDLSAKLSVPAFRENAIALGAFEDLEIDLPHQSSSQRTVREDLSVGERLDLVFERYEAEGAFNRRVDLTTLSSNFSDLDNGDYHVEIKSPTVTESRNRMLSAIREARGFPDIESPSVVPAKTTDQTLFDKLNMQRASELLALGDASVAEEMGTWFIDGLRKHARELKQGNPGEGKTQLTWGPGHDWKPNHIQPDDPAQLTNGRVIFGAGDMAAAITRPEVTYVFDGGKPPRVITDYEELLAVQREFDARKREKIEENRRLVAAGITPKNPTKLSMN